MVAVIGLTFVLFLAGLEIDFSRLRGPVLRLTLLGFGLSFGVAVAVSLGLSAAGLVDTPLLVAIILCATSLGDVHTMMLYPAMSSHREISPKHRERMGIRDNLVRLSVGIEAAEDIVADLEQAFG